MTASYVAIDLETTGLDPKTDSIIEIGAVKIEDGVETDAYAAFVRPARQIPERIMELTGIGMEDVRNAPQPEEVIPELLSFIGELPILGHRVLFDYSFLKRAAVNQKLSFEKTGIDTLRIARRYLPQLESRSLASLCAYYEIAHQAHRAQADAAAAHQVYQRLAGEFLAQDEASDTHSFEPYRLEYKVKRESPASAHQKERLYQLLERHKLEIDYDVERLTRNQASRITDRILAKYGRFGEQKQSGAKKLP